MSGLSFLLLIFRWPPTYSSITSWKNRSVQTYPTWSRNLLASTMEWVVICIPSNVCLDRNILLLAFAVKLPGQSRVPCFHSFRYVGLHLPTSQTLVDVYGARKGFPLPLMLLFTAHVLEITERVHHFTQLGSSCCFKWPECLADSCCRCTLYMSCLVDTQGWVRGDFNVFKSKSWNSFKPFSTCW